MSERQMDTCGWPLHSHRSCGKCRACTAERTRIGHVLSAAQMVVAAYELDMSMMGNAVEKLRKALDYKTV